MSYVDSRFILCDADATLRTVASTTYANAREVTTVKKLTLSSETLRVLTETQARRVVGGTTEYPCAETDACSVGPHCESNPIESFCCTSIEYYEYCNWSQYCTMGPGCVPTRGCSPLSGTP